MTYSADLRTELHALATAWAIKTGLPYYNSNGYPGVVLFEPTPCFTRRGNFEQASWSAINADPAWRLRLTKPHTQKKCLLLVKRAVAMELDSSNSSDALLMNCFCHPSAASAIFAGLGLPWRGPPMHFGFKAQVPLTNGRLDKTEIDLCTGDMLIEAKLTEGSFTHKTRAVVEGYRDFASVFDVQRLPRDIDTYGGYQLIRNVLAAHALNRPFLVLLDERRQDLLEEWRRVVGAISDPALRAKCEFRTWQHVAAVAPPALRVFLEEKYGT